MNSTNTLTQCVLNLDYLQKRVMRLMKLRQTVSDYYQAFRDYHPQWLTEENEMEDQTVMTKWQKKCEKLLKYEEQFNSAQVTSKHKHRCCPCPKWADFVYSLILD